MPLSYPLDDPRDDDVTIGSILKRSATTNSRLPGTLLRNHSIKELVKSTSNTWNKNLNDPQPAQPQQGNEEDEELKLALQRAWAVLDAEQSPQQTENQRIEVKKNKKRRF